jgi:Raf kinase inhibitor-like YbhB/YbcL family protein
MKKLLILLPVVFAVACSQSQNKVNGTTPSAPTSATPFKLTSPAFSEGGDIPSVYTCDSINISPELHWNKITGDVASYVLIMDDPDAPMGTWVHWVMFNIPAADTMLPSHYALDSNMAGDIRQGITSFGTTGYGGPCPPNGSHHYFFKLFAVDATFNMPCRSTGEKSLIVAMKGHILAETGLMGRYQKRSKPVKQ